jgi:hypothetical protein
VSSLGATQRADLGHDPPAPETPILTLTLLLSLSACRHKDATVDTAPLDSDGDGVPDDQDCDPDDDTVTGPGTWFVDEDGDGYGDDATEEEACEPPTNGVAQGGDCDDTRDDIFPSADEICDTYDQDCDTVVDEDAVEMATWYADTDDDAWGDAETTQVICDPGEGWVLDAGDCDDTRDDVNPDAPEICDGETDEDCDELVDEAGADDASTWYADSDTDTFGDPDAIEVACDQPEGFVADATDCDDSLDHVNPDGTEVCDGVNDEDCDETVDEAGASDAATWYADTDTDTYGDAAVSQIACDQPSGYVADSTDCDDSLTDVNPGGTEVCDGVNDEDCDTVVDEAGASDATTWYADTDTDTYGDASVSQVACDQPSGYVADNTDCDDSLSAVNPAGTEICDGTNDEDCDTVVDESGASDATTWYADSDTDTYGDASVSQIACDQPSGYVADSTDCDDSLSAVNPGGTEVCDGTNDEDCDTVVDESGASDATTWYADSDSDTYGDISVSQVACDQPSGYVTDALDCDDTLPLVNPAGTETCDGDDEDCDFVTDEGVLGTGASCPADDCAEILADNSASADGSYTLEDASSTTYTAYCDMTTDSGGWTLVGSVVNEVWVTGSHARSWDSYAAWTDTTTFGSISTRQSADYKGDAYNNVSGDDFMVVTDEYGFGFYNVVGSTDFASFITTEYDASTCSQNFLASGADYYSSELTASQAASFSLVIRPKDTNANCFPTGNENAIIGINFPSCCWTYGLGNTPAGYPSWEVYDNSLLQLTYLSSGTCTAGSYPCNDGGYNHSGGLGYSYANKVVYGELYVR